MIGKMIGLLLLGSLVVVFILANPVPSYPSSCPPKKRYCKKRSRYRYVRSHSYRRCGIYHSRHYGRLKNPWHPTTNGFYRLRHGEWYRLHKVHKAN